MGTDIHIQLEYKKNNRWYWALANIPKGLSLYYMNPMPSDRSYDFFGILANVRNGSGFAGCDTGDGFIPISEPKGLPNDISPELFEKYEKEYILGEHSFSYLTAKEIEDYFIKYKDKKTKKRGWVNSKEYKIFKKFGEPNSWSGGVSGSDINHISNQEMEQRINDDEDKNCYTLIEWEVNYFESLPFDMKWKLTNLKYFIKDKKKIQDVRIVFGFDS